MFLDAAVGRCDVNVRHLVRLGQLPGKGVLAGAASDDQSLLGHFAVQVAFRMVRKLRSVQVSRGAV